jgi:hypothetical protein
VPKPEIAHCGLEHDYSCSSPVLKFADGGRLMQLSFARSPAADWNAEHFGERGGKRGKCKGFSFGSRRRMLNRLNTVSVASRLPYFVTATLPDDVFDDDVARFAATAKRWMDAFIKRLVRVCPSASGFWRIEWQARKSGVHVGKLVPHFHMLVWGLCERQLADREIYDKETGEQIGMREVFEAFVDLPDYQLSLEFVKTISSGPLKDDWKVKRETDGEFGHFVFAGSRKFVERCSNLLLNVEVASSLPDHPFAERAKKMCFSDWASLAWYHVVDSHNVDHLAAGLRVERVRSWGGVMSYCAKYMAKADCEFLSDVEFGRSWGIFNRKSMPWAKIIEMPLDEETGVRIRRIARRYLERRSGRLIRAPYGITLYCDVQNFRRLWNPSPPPDPF